MIEHAAHEFFVKCGEMSNELFLPKKDELKGILIGGPGATKEYFFKENYLHYELQQKVVQPLFDVGYTDDYGLRELVEKATQTLHGLELTEEKQLIQRLLNEIRKAESGLAAYGERDVLRALEVGAVAILLLSEGIRRPDRHALLRELRRTVRSRGARRRPDRPLRRAVPEVPDPRPQRRRELRLRRDALSASVHFGREGSDDLRRERGRSDALKGVRGRGRHPAIPAESTSLAGEVRASDRAAVAPRFDPL